MANILGGVVLPEGAIWRDRRQWSPVGQEVAPTIGGGMVIWSTRLSSGRPITIELTAEHAWVDTNTADALQRLADVPDAVYTMAWDNTSRRVRFKHQDPPALSLEPLAPGLDWFVGQIKLMEV